MAEIVRSATFSNWLSGLADGRARARIQARIDRMADGNFGDVEPIGDGLSEAVFTMVPVTGCTSCSRAAGW